MGGIGRLERFPGRCCRSFRLAAVIVTVVFWMNPFACRGQSDGPDKVVSATSLRRKILCGYQGWFRCPGDAAGMGWIHWSRDRNRIAPSTLTFEMWPDMGEYAPEERYRAPGFTLPDGRKAELFSSDNAATVLRHFEWMRDYATRPPLRAISSALKDSPPTGTCAWSAKGEGCSAGSGRRPGTSRSARDRSDGGWSGDAWSLDGTTDFGRCRGLTTSRDPDRPEIPQPWRPMRLSPGRPLAARHRPDAGSAEKWRVPDPGRSRCVPP